MKKWNIPVTWEMCGIVQIEANTLEEAMEIVKNDVDVPLPFDKHYVDDSFDLSIVEEEIVRECYNDNQEDE